MSPEAVGPGRSGAAVVLRYNGSDVAAAIRDGLRRMLDAARA